MVVCAFVVGAAVVEVLEDVVELDEVDVVSEIEVDVLEELAVFGGAA